MITGLLFLLGGIAASVVTRTLSAVEAPTSSRRVWFWIDVGVVVCGLAAIVYLFIGLTLMGAAAMHDGR